MSISRGDETFLIISRLYQSNSVPAAAGDISNHCLLGSEKFLDFVNTSNNYYLCPELRRKRMIPILARVRAKTLKEFGDDLVRHSDEEFVYVLEGRVEVHTEIYDPLLLEVGESVYIDSTMGHAYLAGQNCWEAVVIGACSSGDESLMESLLSLHGPNHARATGSSAGGKVEPRTRRTAKKSVKQPVL